MNKVKFSQAENRVLFDFLDQLSEDLSNAGCNDLILPKNKENYELAKNALINSVKDKKNLKEEIDILDEDYENSDKLFLFDIAVLDYLTDKLKKILNDKD